MPTELIDRIRRIETKLSRFLSSEPDRGVTAPRCCLDNGSLHFESSGVTLAQLCARLRHEALQGVPTDVYENDRLLFTVTLAE